MKYFITLLYAVLVGTFIGQDCNKTENKANGSSNETIDSREIKPSLTCNDFQNSLTNQILKEEFYFNNIEIKAYFGARVIAVPAPINAHPWIPKTLHFLEAPYKNSSGYITINFEKPVLWAEIDIARGKCDITSSSENISGYFENSNGYKSQSKNHNTGPTVKTMVFTAMDKVKRGGGEFGPPEEWIAAGDIKQIVLNSYRCDIRIWRICYGPDINL